MNAIAKRAIMKADPLRRKAFDEAVPGTPKSKTIDPLASCFWVALAEKAPNDQIILVLA